MTKNNKNKRRHIYKKYIKHFPCDNCITLPMCKALTSEASHPPHFITLLQTRCSLMKDYLEGSDVFGIRTSSARKRSFHKAFEKLNIKERIIKTFYNTED